MQVILSTPGQGPTPPAGRFRYRMDMLDQWRRHTGLYQAALVVKAAFFGYRATRLSSKCSLFSSFRGAVGTGLRPVLGRSETCPTKRMCRLNTSRPMRQDADTRMSMFSRNRFLYGFYRHVYQRVQWFSYFLDTALTSGFWRQLLQIFEFY